MEEFKIVNFQKERPGMSFPWFRKLSSYEAREIAKRIISKWEIDDSLTSLGMVTHLDKMCMPIVGLDANSDEFRLKSTLEDLEIECSIYVYIDWYRFEDTVQMKMEDLNEFFDDVWYSGPDDIFIFDDSLTWILEVSHDGEVKIAKL